jgi:hypothetical protein
MKTLISLRHPAIAASLILVVTVLALPARGAEELTISADKQAFLDRHAAHIADARAGADDKAKAVDAGVPAGDPPDANVYLDPHFQVGSGMVVEVTDPPPGDPSIAVSNLWARSDPWLIVYAGADAADAKSGVVVIVHVGQMKANRLSVAGHGGLRITGGDDSVLVLDAEDGTEFKLDLAAEVLG